MFLPFQTFLFFQLVNLELKVLLASFLLNLKVLYSKNKTIDKTIFIKNKLFLIKMVIFNNMVLSNIYNMAFLLPE